MTVRARVAAASFAGTIAAAAAAVAACRGFAARLASPLAAFASVAVVVAPALAAFTGVAVVAVVAVPRVHAQQAPDVAALQLPAPLELADVARVEVDGDGRLDLAIVAHDPVAKRRELRLHVRAANGAFAGEPSRAPYALERDVVAFAFADVDARAGRELVLLTAERAVAVLPVADGAPEYRPLFAHRLLWPAADPERAVPLVDAVRDVDGDGRDDFVLPEAEAVCVVLQRPPAAKGDAATFSPPVRWQVPEYRSPFARAAAAAGPGRGGPGDVSLRLDFGGDGAAAEDRGPLVQLRARSPRCTFVDFDGDGVRDGITLRNEALWLRSANDLAAPARRVDVPLPEDRLELFDPAFDVQLADVNGDRAADLLVTTSAARDGEVEVRIDLFAQKRDGGPWAARPDGRLRVQTLARPPQLVDADGDAVLDLVVVTVRTDALRALAGDGPTALEAQLNVYRGRGTRFQTPAMLQHVLQLPAGKRRPPTPFVHVLQAPAGGAGALLMRREDRLVLVPFVREDATLAVQPERWHVSIAATGRPLLPAPDATEVLVLDERELVHVRWR